MYITIHHFNYNKVDYRYFFFHELWLHSKIWSRFCSDQRKIIFINSIILTDTDQSKSAWAVILCTHAAWTSWCYLMMLLYVNTLHKSHDVISCCYYMYTRCMNIMMLYHNVIICTHAAWISWCYLMMLLYVHTLHEYHDVISWCYYMYTRCTNLTMLSHDVIICTHAARISRSYLMMLLYVHTLHEYHDVANENKIHLELNIFMSLIMCS